MIAGEETIEAGQTIFQEGAPADFLYFLISGHVDLYYAIEGAPSSDVIKGILVGEINPGEPFGISALIEPHLLSSTAYSPKQSKVIKIEARALQTLFSEDPGMAYLLTYQRCQGGDCPPLQHPRSTCGCLGLSGAIILLTRS